jgi:hypothetical protein
MDELEAQPPAEQTVATPSPQNTPSAESPVPPKDSLFLSDVPPAPPQKRHTQTYKPDQTPWWKVLLEVVALISVIAYTVAAYRQLGVMTGQLTEMGRSTKAAREAAYAACKSAQIANQTLKEIQSGSVDSHNLAIGSIMQAAAVTRGEAAQIRMSPPEKNNVVPTNHFLGDNEEVSNIGKTAAINVRGLLQVVVEDGKQEPDFTFSKFANRMNTGTISPGDKPRLITTYVVEGMKPKRFTDGEFIEIEMAETKRIFIYGRITYLDIFGVRHWMKICRVVVSRTEDRIPKCAAYNQTDLNQVIPRPNQLPSEAKSIEDVSCKRPQ